MILEVVHDHKYDAPPQRRPKGQVTIRGTKRGSSKRSLRAQSSSLDEDLGSDEDEEDDNERLRWRSTSCAV